ncbi:MAG: pilus assembly protein PilP [Deferrisomatales bacterium]|nr:pilus assembly protein PilP [Deferrisomatales bacterium]
MSALKKTASVAVLAAFVACGAHLPSQAAARPTPAPGVAPPADPASEIPVPEETNEPAFSYDPVGLRDPFEPFVRLEEKRPVARVPVFVPRTPLQRYALEEIRLVGVIWAEAGRSVALVEDPEGKGYVVGGGVFIGDRGGRILRIHPDRVDVEERFVDLFGEENVKVMTMTLRKPEGEVNR